MEGNFENLTKSYVRCLKICIIEEIFIKFLYKVMQYLNKVMQYLTIEKILGVVRYRF